MPTPLQPSSRSLRLLRFGGMATLLCLGAVSLRLYLAPKSALLGGLERALGGARFIEARVTISHSHAPCAPDSLVNRTVRVADCPGGDPDRDAVGALSRRAEQGAREHASPDALHTLGLLELLLPSKPRESAARAVEYLRAAARLSPHSAPVLADLSAAYLRRAEVAQTPRDLFQAIEAATQALEADSLNPIARFNLALALEQAGLVEQAASEWKRVADADSAGEWATEADARLHRFPVLPREPEPTASPAELRAYAVQAPQEARLLAMDRLLPQWGEAMLQGDSAAAGARLRAAATISEVLLQQGGDGTLAEEVGDIRKGISNPATLLILAAAHVAYGAGEQARKGRRWADARAAFERAMAGSAASPALRGWAEYGSHVTRYFAGEANGAEGAFTRIAEQTDTVRFPALAARARWSLGLLHVRASKYAAGIEQFAAAARLFDRVGEREHLGAVQSLESEACFELGDTPAAYALMQKGMTALRPYRASLRLHNHLYAISLITVADGFPRAALRVQHEDVAVAARVHPAVHTEAVFAHALALVAAGETKSAEAEIAVGERLIRTLENTLEGRWYQQNARLARAGLLLRQNPSQAAVQLDSIVEYFAGPDMSHRLLPALLQRAEARVALSDVRGAIEDLDRATLVLAGVSTALQNAALRAMMLESAQESFDRLVMLRVRAGQPDSALAALERSRARITADGPDNKRSLEHGSPRQGGTLLNYALIGDTLLIWMMRGPGVELRRSIVRRDTLLNTVERLRVALELGADDEAVRRDLTSLHGWLIRPVQDRLLRGTPLIIVADGEVAAAPFAALFDAGRGRYLVQDHTLRFASSLPDARRAAPDHPASVSAAVFLADPAFDPRVYPELSRLRGAVDEVRAVAGNYPGARVLIDTAATRDALHRSLVGASLLHFAGHAVFDDERPEQSYLVLAGGSRGRLDADSLRAMDLRHLRLVVLSACQTQRARSGRSGGFAGLSGAMLEAGASGVIGSLWRVDDILTRELMTEFHRAYMSSGDGADALRAAQLRLLASADAALRSPSAWAGFRYSGT